MVQSVETQSKQAGRMYTSLSSLFPSLIKATSCDVPELVHVLMVANLHLRNVVLHGHMRGGSDARARNRSCCFYEYRMLTSCAAVVDLGIALVDSTTRWVGAIQAI